MAFLTSLASVAALVGLWAAPALAAGAAEAARPIVAEVCSKCHRVPGYDGTAAEGVSPPDFQAIADDPTTYTTARLTAYLRKPHFPMKSIILSPRDIDNLVAFIEALRRD